MHRSFAVGSAPAGPRGLAVVSLVACATVLAAVAGGCDKKPSKPSPAADAEGAGAGAATVGGPSADAGQRAVSLMLSLGSLAEVDDVIGAEWKGDDTSEEVERLLQRAGGQIEAFISIPSVDKSGYQWPRDASRAIQLTRQFYVASVLVYLDAERCLHKKDAEGAARRLAALVRMCRYFGEYAYDSDSWIVAAEVLGRSQVIFIRDPKAIKTAAWRTELAHEVDKVDPRNPLGLRTAVVEDLTVWRDYLLRAEKVPLFRGGTIDLSLIGRKEREKMAADLLAIREELGTNLANLDLDAIFATLSKLRSSQVYRVLPAMGQISAARTLAFTALARMRAAAM